MFAISGLSQSNRIIMQGKVQVGEIISQKEKKKRKKVPDELKDITVTINDSKGILNSFNTEGKSFYRIQLSPEMNYQVEFKKIGFIPKILEINTYGMPEKFASRGFDLYTDIALFKDQPYKDFSAYSKTPVAICKYNKRKNALIWDMDYANNSFKEFINILESPAEYYIEEEYIVDEIDYEEELRTLETMSLNINLRLLGSEQELQKDTPIFSVNEKLNEPVEAEAAINKKTTNEIR